MPKPCVVCQPGYCLHLHAEIQKQNKAERRRGLVEFLKRAEWEDLCRALAPWAMRME